MLRVELRKILTDVVGITDNFIIGTSTDTEASITIRNINSTKRRSIISKLREHGFRIVSTTPKDLVPDSIKNYIEFVLPKRYWRTKKPDPLDTLDQSGSHI